MKTTEIETRAQWGTYHAAKDAARAAGACRQCSQRLAMAKVRYSQADPWQAPELCGRCARLFTGMRAA
jgi:hypothetical protein